MLENAKSYALFSDTNKVILGMYCEANSQGTDPNHQHPQLEIMLTVNGRAQIEIRKEKVIDIAKGDILIFRSMEIHRIYNIPPQDPLEIISVTFNSNTLLDDESNWFLPKFFDIFHSGNDFQNKISQETKCAKEIRKLLLEEKAEFEDTGASNNEFIIKSKFLEILARLYQYHCTFYEQNKIKTHKHLQEIEDTLAYINQHLTENITLEQLAKIANMSKSYYCTFFKELNGMTVWNFIQNERINLAISYLLNTPPKTTILEIATMCGFNNTVHFNKCFKEITGMTPREYRKKLAVGEM